MASTEATQKAGVDLGGDRLKSTIRDARVRVRDGKSMVLDGTQVDAKEQLAGYQMIEVPSIDEALSWAGRCPTAKYGTIHARPIADLPAA